MSKRRFASRRWTTSMVGVGVLLAAIVIAPVIGAQPAHAAEPPVLVGVAEDADLHEPGRIRVSPDGTHVWAVSAAAGSTTVLALEGTDRAPTWRAASNVNAQPWDIAYSTDSSRMYVTSRSGTVDVLDAGTGVRLDRLNMAADTTGIAVVSVGGRDYAYIARSNPPTVRVFNLFDSAPVDDIVLPFEPRVVTAGPGGSVVYVGGLSGSVVKINTATNALSTDRGEVEGGAGHVVRDLAVTPDGQRLFVANDNNAGGNGFIDGFTTNSLQHVNTTDETVGHEPPFTQLAITPDGETVYGAAGGNTSAAALYYYDIADYESSAPNPVVLDELFQLDPPSAVGVAAAPVAPKLYLTGRSDPGAPGGPAGYVLALPGHDISVGSRQAGIDVPVTIPDGICAIDWAVVGGSGGYSPGGGPGGNAGEVVARTAVTPSRTYLVQVGEAGDNAAASGNGGRSGSESSGGAGAAGAGGGASVVRTGGELSSPRLIVAAGGGGSGTLTAGGTGGETGSPGGAYDGGSVGYEGGGGATISGPGAGGGTSDLDALWGMDGSGPRGGDAASGAGAGGGGFFGGGSGATQPFVGPPEGYGAIQTADLGDGAGGGGGANLAPEQATNATNVDNAGNGHVYGDYVECVPAEPTGLTADPADAAATVGFTPPAGPVDWYEYSLDDSDNWTRVATTGESTLVARVSPLTNGRLYGVRMRAVNATGPGAASASTSVTPAAQVVTPEVPGTPGIPLVASGNARVTVTIAAPTTGGQVAVYTVRAVNDSTRFCTVTPPAAACVVNDLVNGTTYRFEARATNSGGTSAWSGWSAGVAPFGLPIEPVTPSVPSAPAAPTSVTATAGTASLTASWAAVSGATGYTATARPGPATCASTGSRCVLGAVAGTSYTVTVTADGPGGTSAASAASNAVTPLAPVVPAVPSEQVPTTLTTDKGQISLAVPGQRITVIGTGFAPRSTATIILYSAPITLGTVVTDANGSFSIPVTIPAGLVPGEHTFLASGVNSAGVTRQIALPVTVAPTSTGSTGNGTDTPNTTIPVPADGSITLLDREGTQVATVTVAQGTYALDAATGAIMFVPVKGFVGRATPVAYRITDSVGSVVTGSFTATVTGGGGNDPGPPASTGSARVLVGKLAVTRGVPARATLPAVVAFTGVTKARNTGILWSTVSGKRVILGTGRAAMAVGSRRAAVTVVLNPLGRAVAATPGGYPVAVAMTTVPAAGGRTLRASSRTRLVLSQFTVPRGVFFASGSAAVSSAQERYLTGLRTKLSGVRSVTCVGHTDDRGGKAAGLRLGKRRALRVCRDLTARLNVRTSVVTWGEANPSGSNSTSGGMARNRRVDITIRY